MYNADPETCDRVLYPLTASEGLFCSNRASFFRAEPIKVLILAEFHRINDGRPRGSHASSHNRRQQDRHYTCALVLCDPYPVRHNQKREYNKGWYVLADQLVFSDDIDEISKRVCKYDLTQREI